MKVYFDSSALEKIASGRPLYSWDYILREDTDPPPKGGILVGEFQPVMPEREACIAPALAALAEKETELREELNEELVKIKARRDALIMLEFSA
jgi:hypothetical protein